MIKCSECDHQCKEYKNLVKIQKENLTPEKDIYDAFSAEDALSKITIIRGKWQKKRRECANEEFVNTDVYVKLQDAERDKMIKLDRFGDALAGVWFASLVCAILFLIHACSKTDVFPFFDTTLGIITITLVSIILYGWVIYEIVIHSKYDFSSLRKETEQQKIDTEQSKTLDDCRDFENSLEKDMNKRINKYKRRLAAYQK